MMLNIIATAAAGLFYVDSERRTHKIFIQKVPMNITRGTFTQTPTQRIFRMLMQGPLEEGFDRISTRSSDKDLGQIM